MKKFLSLIFLIFILIGCQKELPKLDMPLNVFIEDNIINITEVPNASHYVLFINGKSTTITETTYLLTQPGVYTIKVKAQGKGYKDSDFTTEITHYILGDNPNLKYTYSLKSTSDLIIYDLSINNPSINLTKVDQEYVVYTNNMVQVKSDYLQTLSLGIHDFILTINDIPFKIQIEIIADETPYLMINSNYYFNRSLDIIVRFDELNSTVHSVSGDSLTISDYTLSEGMVRIDKEFMLKYFEEHPEYNMFVLTIRFQEDNKTHLARVWIHKN